MDKPIASASKSLSDYRQAKREPRRDSQPQGGERVGGKIAALPAGPPYAGTAKRNVYLFTPTEAERDLLVQALRAFAAASPEREFMMRVP